MLTIISQGEQLFREIVNYEARRGSQKIGNVNSFRKEVQGRLRFEKESDWMRLCSLLDILGDTELAKENFMEFGLLGNDARNGVAEKYIRLYGILNCIYLQRSALIHLLEVFKVPHKNTFKSKLDSISLIQLRHMAGAHTIDYSSISGAISHQISRYGMTTWEVEILNSQGEFKQYDIRELIFEYNFLAEEILIKSLEKAISTIYKGNTEGRSTLTHKLMLIKP